MKIIFMRVLQAKFQILIKIDIYVLCMAVRENKEKGIASYNLAFLFLLR